ncbi:MAG TPA: hypothetical protein VGN37_29610 [Actinocatenispora sp.]
MVPRLVRLGVAALAATQFAVGGWIVVAPRSFFAWRWVSLGESYNEHLLLDVGVFNLALAVLLALAAAYGERRLVRVALLAFLTYAVGHLAVHATHRDAFDAAEATELLLTLGVDAVVPAVLLAATRRPGRNDREG